jgi:hypothetical protein
MLLKRKTIRKKTELRLRWRAAKKLKNCAAAEQWVCQWACQWVQTAFSSVSKRAKKNFPQDALLWPIMFSAAVTQMQRNFSKASSLVVKAILWDA